MILRNALTGIVLATCIACLNGQEITADFTPDVAAPGSTNPINFRIYNNSAVTWASSSPCDWFAIFGSLANGQPDLANRIEHYGFCTDNIVFTAPGEFIDWTWNQLDGCPGCPLPSPPPPAQVPPGRYWFHAFPNPTATPAPEAWFCFSIQDSFAPSMIANGPTRVGQTTGYAISSPADPFSAFAVLLSFHTDNAIGAVPFLGIDLCLAAPLFGLGSGTLDVGGAGAFSFTVPNIPALVDDGFHLQTVIVRASGAPLLASTNSVAHSIRP